MKWFFLLLAAGVLFTACSGLPKVHPAIDSATLKIQTCPDPYPKGRWQFVHSIEAVMPGGRSAFVTGVALISSVDRSFRCIIMTMEGLTVFDAEWDRELTVNRAIAPFDSKPFAKGLAEDIRLLFLQPLGAPIESGFLKGGASICRYRDSDGGVVDVVSKGSGDSEIRRYAHDLRLLRSVSMTSGRNTGQAGIPERIELKAYGSQGYELIMNLVQAEPIKE